MRLLTGEEMRQADAIAIMEYGIPGVVLMENAGRALAFAADAMLAASGGHKVTVITGGGNNGGDGFVAARHLHNMGHTVRLFLLVPPEKLKGDALLNWQIIEKMGMEAQVLTDERRLNVLKLVLGQSDLLIDAILGTGLKENVRGLAAPLIQTINESRCPVLAADIPSGLCADRGIPLGLAVEADKTITFAHAKLGLFLPDAARFTGQVEVADISMPADIVNRLGCRRELLDADFCRLWLAPREKQSHKGNFGHLLMVAGSPTMPGAAIMAGLGALQMGVGLFSAAIPSAIRNAFAARLPEAMFLQLPQTNAGLLAAAAAEQILDFNANAYLIGPGLGRQPETGDLVRRLLAALTRPAVLDADALFAIGQETALLHKNGVLHIVTPHPGEMARLCGISVAELQRDRLKIATACAAEWQTVVVLKGAGTVVADPDGRIFLNTTGNPGMATGGSGDVLAGMIASLLAQGLPPASAAACAVWMHGRAGDLAAAAKSRLSLLPTDIAAYTPQVHQELSADI